MKSLHKKIGAMVLAGMVVLGGVAAGGVNSFAASNKSIKASQNLGQEMDVKRVQFYSKAYGQIVLIENKMNNSERSVSVNKKNCYNRGKAVVVQNPAKIPVHLQDAKRCKSKFVKIGYHDVIYIIELK